MEDIKVQIANSVDPEISVSLDGLTEKEAKELAKISKRFMNSYINKNEQQSEQEWLFDELKKELPEKDEKEIMEISTDIIQTIKEFDDNLKDINVAASKGVSKESWYAQKVAEAATGVSIIDYGNYLNSIDVAITNANAQMMRTVSTNAGPISQCINLDGFIAEQNAVNTFNMQAQLESSKYYAEVLVPEPGQTYGLNSFDAVIKDSVTGKIVHQYQFKFGKDAKSTIALLKDGNYNNQRFVVPKEQVEAVRQAFPGKSVEAHIGGTETVTFKSDSLTKSEAKELQINTQEKNVLPRKDWNAFNTKEIALNIGKNAGLAGLQSAMIATGFDLAAKAIKGEPINGEETVEIALTTGADTGVKAAMAGALKVGSEKGIISCIPQGTPVAFLTNVVCLGIENAKILAKLAKGEITLLEALDQMGRTSTSMIYGFSAGATGMAIGAVALAWIPIVGPFVGGLVGGMVGYMAGSKFGNAVYSAVKTVGSVVKSAASKVWSGVKSVGSKIGRAIGRFFR